MFPPPPPTEATLREFVNWYGDEAGYKSWLQATVAAPTREESAGTVGASQPGGIIMSHLCADMPYVYLSAAPLLHPVAMRPTAACWVNGGAPHAEPARDPEPPRSAQPRPAQPELRRP